MKSIVNSPGNEKSVNETYETCQHCRILKTRLNSTPNNRRIPNQGDKIVSRRRYANAVGRIGQGDDQYDSDSMSPYVETTNDRAITSRGNYQSPERRGYIRERLKQKAKVPGHVAWTKWMNSDAKNHFVALVGEFIGTFMFLFFAFAGTTTANKTPGDSSFNPSTTLYIALSFGFSLMVNAWIFFRISGGLFNPAVTFALLLTRDLDPIRAILVFIGQLTGACFASYLVSVVIPSGLNVQTTLGAGTTVAQGIWIEAICTAGLIFTIIMLAKEKHQATFVAPVGIGLSLFIGELAAVYYTGGSFNPARSFGPAAVSGHFFSTHWIYWIGPPVGSILAVLFYQLMKILEYEMANPGQDGDIKMDPTQNPDHELALVQEERQAEVEEIRTIEKEGGSEDVMGHVSSNADSVAMDQRTAQVVAGVNPSRFPAEQGGGPDLEAQGALQSPTDAVERRLSSAMYLNRMRSKRRGRIN